MARTAAGVNAHINFDLPFALLATLRRTPEFPATPDSPDHALVFTARVGDKEINGCDFLHLDEDGLIDDLTVMVRPLSAAVALSEAMGAQFEQIAEEAAGA